MVAEDRAVRFVYEWINKELTEFPEGHWPQLEKKALEIIFPKLSETRSGGMTAHIDGITYTGWWEAHLD